jgi:hypothetical protein
MSFSGVARRGKRDTVNNHGQPAKEMAANKRLLLTGIDPAIAPRQTAFAPSEDAPPPADVPEELVQAILRTRSRAS